MDGSKSTTISSWALFSVLRKYLKRYPVYIFPNDLRDAIALPDSSYLRT